MKEMWAWCNQRTGFWAKSFSPKSRDFQVKAFHSNQGGVQDRGDSSSTHFFFYLMRWCSEPAGLQTWRPLCRKNCNFLFKMKCMWAEPAEPHLTCSRISADELIWRVGARAWADHFCKPVLQRKVFSRKHNSSQKLCRSHFAKIFTKNGLRNNAT